MKSLKSAYPASVWTALGAVYLVWGSTYLAIRFAVASIPPFVMAGTRFVAAGFILYGLARIFGAARPAASHWKSTAVVGFLLVTVSNGGVSWIEQKVPSGVTALLVGMVPVWVVFLEWVWKGAARPSFRVWAGLCLGLLGIAALVFLKPGEGIPPVNPLDVLFLAGTSITWALGSLYSRDADLPPSPILATAMEMILGGFFQLLAAFLLGEFSSFHFSAVTSSSLEAWAYLSLVGSLVGYTSYIWVLQKSTPKLASTYAFVNPVIAVLLGWILAGESLTPVLGFSAFLIGTAVVLISFRKIGEDR